MLFVNERNSRDSYDCLIMGLNRLNLFEKQTVLKSLTSISIDAEALSNERLFSSSTSCLNMDILEL
jgi:hypothetical protein